MVAMTDKKRTIVRLSDQVQPHFKKMWNTKCPFIVLKGGRGSFKSATIAIKLVAMMLSYIQKGYTVNVIVIRENQTNLRDTVYKQIMWALNLLHVETEFRQIPSRLRIQHRRTGSTFYFYGADKPEKLKSNTVGNIIAVWCEEFANFKNAQVDADIIPTFERQGPKNIPEFDHVRFYYSYNPPINEYDWVNKWISQKEKDPRYFIDHSTYLDDKLGFSTKQTLDTINSVKKNDPDFYDWQFLGKVVGLGTAVYNTKLFKRMDKIPDDDSIANIYFGADTGHAKSADAVVCVGILRKLDENGLPRVVVLDMYYYSPEGKAHPKSPSQVSVELKDFIEQCEKKYLGYDEYGRPRKAMKLTMDSAEGALRNQQYQDYGIIWHPVPKKKEYTMIEFVQNLLAQGRVYYMPTSNILGYFIPQHKKYRWDENTLQSDDPKVIKKDDHSVDAFKYFVIDNLYDLKLAY